MSARPPRWPAALAAAFGLVLFLSQGGAAALNPKRVDWIAPGSDWAYHLVAWEYFRAAPWQLPLGAIPDLLHPVGTTVALTDVIPWVSLPAKLLAPILPEPFQFIGPWLALCYALAGWFGARLGQALGARPWSAAIIGAFFALSPVLMHRVPHDGLSAHFLILAALAAAVSPRREQTLWGAILVPIAAFGVHPYLFAMVYPLALAALVRGAWIDRLFSWRVAAAGFAGMTAVCLAMAWLLGLLHASFATDALGFGHYGTDLATFVTTQDESWLLPDLPGDPARWEGYAYLGLGGIVLTLGALVQARRPRRRELPVVVVVVAMALFALAEPIRLFGKPIIPTRWFWQHLAALTGAFRSSGRFIWPLYYAVLAGAVAVWLARRPRAAPWVLLAIVALQIADAKEAFFGPELKKRFPPVTPAPIWELARGEYRHLVLYPPRCGDGSGTCCPGFSVSPPPGADTSAMMNFARLGLTTNSGGVGRLDRAAHRVACDALAATIASGKLDRLTIYQIAPGHEVPFFKSNRGAVCGPVEGVLTCVTPDAPERFRVRLAQE